MPWRSVVLKPLYSARTLYDPGWRLGALYSPASFVTKVFVTPLSVSTTVTVAPDTVPPLWSVTVPMIRPKLPCEHSGRQSRSTPITPPRICKALRTRTPQDLLSVECNGIISGPPVQILSREFGPMLPPKLDPPTIPTSKKVVKVSSCFPNLMPWHHQNLSPVS